MNAGGRRLAGQWLRTECGWRRQLLCLVQPKGRVTLASHRLCVALIFFNHFTEGTKRRRVRLLIARHPGVNMGNSAGNGGETEAIHQNMVITLIPEPTLIRQTDQHMAIQCIAAADA
ncbi:hypothetical protein D3C81_851140 [compost metagenome]